MSDSSFAGRLKAVLRASALMRASANSVKSQPPLDSTTHGTCPRGSRSRFHSRGAREGENPPGGIPNDPGGRQLQPRRPRTIRARCERRALVSAPDHASAGSGGHFRGTRCPGSRAAGTCPAYFVSNPYRAMSSGRLTRICPRSPVIRSRCRCMYPRYARPARRRREPLFVRAQRAAWLLKHRALAVRDVEEKHHRGVSRKREPAPLAEGVDGSVDVAGARPRALWLRPENPLVE